jgi:hypothetical protein
MFPSKWALDEMLIILNSRAFKFVQAEMKRKRGSGVRR